MKRTKSTKALFPRAFESSLEMTQLQHDSIIMLNEVKHLVALHCNTLRCFATFNMTL